MKGPFLILSSPVVRFQHTFPALQSSPTINIFHLLEPSLPAQLVSFPSPTTYMVSQTFLSSLTGTPVGTVSPSLLPSATSTSSSKLSCLSCQKVNAWKTSGLLGHLPYLCLVGSKLTEGLCL